MSERSLLPVSVYLSPLSIAEAQVRADDAGLALATLLRLILIGQQPPLRARGKQTSRSRSGTSKSG